MSEHDNKAIFAKNLKRLLASANEKQTDLVQLLGVSKSTVSSWCKAQRMPRMDKIDDLARHFGVPYSELLGQGAELEHSEKGLAIEFPVAEPAGPHISAGLDDFSYAIFDEIKELNDEDKQKLLEIARIFRQQQSQED